MKKVIKKSLHLMLVLGLVISGVVGQVGINNVFASSEKTNLIFKSNKKNYLEVEKEFDIIPKTLEISIRHGKAGNKREIIIGNYVYQKNCFALELTADNQLRYVEFVYEAGKIVSSIDYKVNMPELFDENWHNLAYVRDVDNNKVLFYADGVLKDTLVLDGTGTNVLKDNVPLDEVHYVGTDARKTYYLDADIHEIRMWDIVRNAEEINRDQEVELTGQETGLQNNWVFDETILDTENTLILNKVKDQPGLTVVNFNLPKPRTFLEFDSAQRNYIELTKNLEKAPKTIDFWAKFDKNPNKRQLIFSNYVYGKNAMGLEITADNQLRYVEFGYENGTLTGSLDVRTAGQEICNDKWSHFAVVRDIENNAVKIYKNGVEIVNQQLTNEGTNRLTKDLSFENKHYIGTDFRNASSYYLDGKIDNLSLWDMSITGDKLMNLEITGNEEGLLHSWDFNFEDINSTNPIIKDKKESGTDGFAVNFDFSDIPQYTNEGTDFSNGDIEIEMEKAFDQAPLTFETWLKMPKSAASSRGGVIAGNLFDAYYRDIPIVNFEIFNNGVPRLYWSVEEKTYDYKANGINVCTNQWTHLAVTYDQINKKMATYINGEKVHEATLDVNIKALNQPVKIGKDSRNAYNFKGELADLRIWSTTRTAEQIKDNFNIEIEDEAGLLGSWKLDKEINSQYHDSSLNQNHAKNYWMDGDLFAKSEDGYSSIAIIPDTQTLAMSAPASFTKLTNWIRNSQKELGIGAVIHVGDIVNERDSHSQWTNAKNSMKLLDGVVPYVFSAGNHDVEIQKIDGVWYGLRNTPLMNQYFPYSEVSSQSTFGGAYKEGEVDNTYSYFTINDVDLMIISLEQSPRPEVLEWADKVTEENKDRKVIVTTHEYLNFDGNTTTRETQDHLDFVGGSTTGEEMWEAYVKKHVNITAVVAGHVGYPDLVSTKRVGENGNVVTQILCDAQFMDRDDVNNGSGKGLGMVMILSFKGDSNEIKVNWYSTVREQFYREKNQYTDTLELVSNVNKTELQSLYDEYSVLKEENYTLQTWTIFANAMADAKNMLERQNATQAEVDTVKTALQNARNGLVEKEVETNKAALSIAVEVAGEVTQEQLDKVVPAVVSEFKAALANAQRINTKNDATQDEVDEAFNRLAKAMQMLEFIKGDKVQLQKIVDQIATLNAEDYIKTTWDAMTPALTKANEVLANVNAMQEEVEQTHSDLVKAFLNLRLKPNKDLLGELINKANSLNAVNYTMSSMSVVNEALDLVKAVYDNPEATSKEVKEAEALLTKALASLEAKPETTVDSNTTNTVKTGDTTVTATKTGDKASMGYSLAGLAIASIIFYGNKKRKTM